MIRICQFCGAEYSMGRYKYCSPQCAKAADKAKNLIRSRRHYKTEKRKQYLRQYFEEHKQKFKKYMLRYNREYYAVKKDIILANQKKWRKKRKAGVGGKP